MSHKSFLEECLKQSNALQLKAESDVKKMEEMKSIIEDIEDIANTLKTKLEEIKVKFAKKQAKDNFSNKEIENEAFEFKCPEEGLEKFKLPIESIVDKQELHPHCGKEGNEINCQKCLLNKLGINAMCTKHPDQPLTILCEDDDVFCCEHCVFSSHRNCQNTLSITQIDNTFTSNISDRDMEKITHLLGKVTKMEEDELIISKESNQKSKDFICQIKKRIDTVSKELNRKKIEIDKVFSANEKTISEGLAERHVTLKNLKETLELYLQTLQADQTLSPSIANMARYKVCRSLKVNTEKCVNTLLDGIPSIKFFLGENGNIDLNWDISIDYKQTDISEFSSECKRIIDTLSLHQPHKGSIQSVREIKPLFTLDLSPLTSTKRSNINAGIDIIDGTYLNDNNVLISDFHNQQLIMLDENLNFLNKFKVAGKPMGVCLSGDGNHLHVVCDDNSLVNYALNDLSMEVNRFQIEKDARGVASHGDRIAIGHPDKIIVYDLAGKLISKVDAYESFHPVLSHDGRLLYYCDEDDVVCRLTEDITKEEWRHSSKALSVPYAIDKDREGNILILTPREIHHLSKDGTQRRVIVKTLKSNPWGLFYNKNNDTICVTLRDQELCIETFQFELAFF